MRDGFVWNRMGGGIIGNKEVAALARSSLAQLWLTYQLYRFLVKGNLDDLTHHHQVSAERWGHWRRRGRQCWSRDWPQMEQFCVATGHKRDGGGAGMCPVITLSQVLLEPTTALDVAWYAQLQPGICCPTTVKHKQHATQTLTVCALGLCEPVFV